MSKADEQMPLEIWTDINGHATRTQFNGGVRYIRAAEYDALREQNRVLWKALEELIAAVRAVQSAPAVMLVSECSIDANTGEEHQTEVSQDFINALWNEAIDVTDRAQAVLTATRQPQ